MIDLINHEYVLSDLISMQRSIYRAKKDHKYQNILAFKTFGVFPRAMGQTVSTIGPESDFDDDDSKLDVASSLIIENQQEKINYIVFAVLACP